MHSLKLTSLNVKNLKTNYLYVCDLMQNNDICYLTETWLNDGETTYFETMYSECKLYFQCDITVEESYNLKGRPFGGKCWLIRKNLVVKKVNFINKIISLMEIETENDTLLLIGVYIPFDDNSAYRYAQLKSTLELIASIIEDNLDKTVLVVGDFNADLKREKRYDKL